jgi:hypothetical protein
MLLNRILPLIACLALTACAGAKDSTSQDLDAVGNETSASYNKVRDDMGLGHKEKVVVTKEVQPRYCYKTYQDIICYSKPLPGEEYRLTGFQTASGKTGYVLPEKPVPGGNDDELPPLKTVSVGAPPAVKGEGKDDSQLKEIIFDPSELEPKELVPDKQQ